MPSSEVLASVTKTALLTPYFKHGNQYADPDCIRYALLPDDVMSVKVIEDSHTLVMHINNDNYKGYEYQRYAGWLVSKDMQEITTVEQCNLNAFAEYILKIIFDS